MLRRLRPCSPPLPELASLATSAVVLLLLLGAAPAAAAPRGLRLESGAPVAGPTASLAGPTVLLQPGPHGVDIELELDGLILDEQSTPRQGRFGRVTLPGEGLTTTIGRPRLPVVRRLLPVPAGARLELQVISVESETHSLAALGVASPLLPVQQPEPKLAERNRLPSLLRLDRTFYRTAGFTPSQLGEIAPAGVLAGQAVAQLTLQPVQYDPTRAELRIVRRASLRLTVSGGEPAPRLDARQRGLLRRLLPWAPAPAARSAKSEDPALDQLGYLVIAAPALVGSPALAELVGWKTEKGFTTTLVSTAQTGVTKEAIKTYLQQAYDGWDVRPAYVLLVGDTDSIPSWTSQEEDRPATDLHYGLLAGNDYLPDVPVGRLPVRTADQLANLVRKILEHEHHDAAAGWEQNVCLAAGVDNSNITEGTHNAVIRDRLTPRGFSYDRFYASQRSDEDDVLGALAAGRSLITYSGHGDVDGWTDGIDLYINDLRGLANAVEPFVMSFACLTGSYQEAECYGEAWVRNAAGAVAFLGSSVTSYWEEDDVFELALYAAMLPAGGVPGLTTLGELLTAAKAGLYDNYGGRGSTRRYYDMYNLLGDPSLDLWTAAPQPLDAQIPQVLPVGSTRLELSTGAAGARVGVTVAGELVGAATAGDDGQATVQLDPAGVASPVRLLVTVTAHDRLPLQQEVQLLSSGDGLVVLGSPVVGPRRPDVVTVADLDLAGQGELQLEARLADAAPGSGLSLTLLEDEQTQGLFHGALAVACLDRGGEAGDEVLGVRDAEQVELIYRDADDGLGGHDLDKTVRVTVDCAPPVFAGLNAARAGQGQVELAWADATDLDAPLTYRIYRAEQRGGQDFATPLASTSKTSFVDESVVDGTWYYYVVRAADGLDNEDANAREARALPQQAGPVVTFPLDVDPGWTAEGQWAYGQPTGAGGEHGSSDPRAGATGERVYGYNLAGDYADSLRHTEYLTTSAIDCSTLSDVELVFKRWLGTEGYDKVELQASTDGVHWQQVWSNSDSEVADRSWTTVRYDLSALADGQPTLFLRWGLGPTDDSYRYCGWNLDDIEIWGVRLADEAGRLTLDRAVYGVAKLVTITLQDRGASVDPSLVGTATVRVRSGRTSGAGLTVTLTETQAGSGVFVGSLPLDDAQGAGDPPQAALPVDARDSIEVVYADPDNGGGLPQEITATATVDLEPPTLGGLSIDGLGARTVSVHFTSSEPTEARVELRPSDAPSVVLEAGQAELALAHTLTFTELAPRTRYQLRIIATDPAGNVATLAPDGEQGSFTTLEPELGPVGIVLFDKLAYEVPATARLTVYDTDLDLHPGGVDRITVRVSGVTEEDGESVELVEERPGVLSGELALAFGEARADDGTLQIAAPSETLRARYLDADDGTGISAERTAQAEALLVLDPARLQFAALPAAVDAGVPFAVTVRLLDRYGRLISGDAPTQAALTDTTGTVTPAAIGPFVEGSWSGPVTIRGAGDAVVLHAQVEGVVGDSDPLVVRPGPATLLGFSPIGDQRVDEGFTVEVTAQDAYGNLVTGVSGELELTDRTGTLSFIGGPAQLTGGRWQGQVVVHESASADILEAELAELTGASVEFAVTGSGSSSGDGGGRDGGCSVAASRSRSGVDGLLALLLVGLLLAGRRRR